MEEPIQPKPAPRTKHLKKKLNRENSESSKSADDSVLTANKKGSIKRPGKPPPVPIKKPPPVPAKKPLTPRTSLDLADEDKDDDDDDENEYSVPLDNFEYSEPLQETRDNTARKQRPPLPSRPPVIDRLSTVGTEVIVGEDEDDVYCIPIISTSTTESREDNTNMRPPVNSPPSLPLRPPSIMTLTPSRVAPKPSKTTWYISLDLLTNEYRSLNAAAAKKRLFTEPTKPMVKYDSVYSRPAPSPTNPKPITPKPITPKPITPIAPISTIPRRQSKPHIAPKPSKRRNIKKSKSVFYSNIDVRSEEDNVSESFTSDQQLASVLTANTTNVTDIHMPPIPNDSREGSIQSETTTTPPPPDHYVQTDIGPRCVVTRNHSRSTYEELDLRVGDVIEMQYRDWDDKVMGRLRDVVGIFSLADVNVIEELPEDIGDKESVEGVQPISSTQLTSSQQPISSQQPTTSVPVDEQHTAITANDQSTRETQASPNTSVPMIDFSTPRKVPPTSEHFIKPSYPRVRSKPTPTSLMDMPNVDMIPPSAIRDATPSNEVIPPTSTVDTPIQDMIPPTSHIDTPIQDIIPPTSHIDTPIQDIIPPTSHIDTPIQDIIPPTSHIDTPIQDIIPPTSHIDTPIQDIIPPTSHIDTPIQDIIPPTSHIDTPNQDIIPPTSPVDTPINEVTSSTSSESISQSEDKIEIHTKRVSRLISQLNIKHIHNFPALNNNKKPNTIDDNRISNTIDSDDKSSSITDTDTIHSNDTGDENSNICPISPSPEHVDILENESCISAVVLHEFKSENNSELDLYPGDTIVDLYVVDSDWMKGTLQSDVNKSGIFPSSFVKVNGDITAIRSLIMKAQALFSFVAENQDEMTIEAGDLIENISELSADWLVGSSNGKRGMFPVSYVQIIN